MICLLKAIHDGVVCCLAGEASATVERQEEKLRILEAAVQRDEVLAKVAQEVRIVYERKWVMCWLSWLEVCMLL